MKTCLRTLLIFACFAAVACSQEWRQGDAGLTGDEVLAYLAEANSPTSASTGSSGIASALAYKDDPNTTIFFADAPGPLGKVPEVLALDDMDFLGTGQDLWYGNIKFARIFFLDSPGPSDRQDGVVFGIAQDDGQYKYYGFSGQGAIRGGQFEAALRDAAGHRVTLRSWDIDGDDLKGVIQLRVYEYDGSGNEYYVGKITTLVGYGP